MSGFDRLPSRSQDTPGSRGTSAPAGSPAAGSQSSQGSPGEARGDGAVDAQGKRALFSTAPAVPAAGSVTVDCPACGARTVLSPRQALRAALPSLHLPLLRRGAASWMRCPACGKRTWVHARLRL